MALMAAFLAPGTGRAGMVGEPAPALNVSEWLKGGPVEIKPGTNVYVVEIWNSSSAGCRAAITNLNAIQQRYGDKGVVLVAVSDEGVDKLKPFMKGEGTNIQYTVAADNKRYTSLTYMNPVMRRVIPYTFVVGTNGDLLWHGTPFQGLEHTLFLVTSKAFDEEAAKQADLATHQLEQYLLLAHQGGDRLKMAGYNLLAARTNDVPGLCTMAYAISITPKLAVRDMALAGQALDQAEKLSPTNTASVMIPRAIWLFESGKHEEGLELAKKALAFAESPAEKSNIGVCIRTMENRIAGKPDNAGAESAGGANQGPAGAPPAGKP
jgi:thiol-disulfide isomerase/thioredoxin